MDPSERRADARVIQVEVGGHLHSERKHSVLEGVCHHRRRGVHLQEREGINHPKPLARRTVGDLQGPIIPPVAVAAAVEPDIEAPLDHTGVQVTPEQETGRLRGPGFPAHFPVADGWIQEMSKVQPSWLRLCQTPNASSTYSKARSAPQPLTSIRCCKACSIRPTA